MWTPEFEYYLFILINYFIVLIFVTVSIFTSPKPIIVTDALDLLSFAAVFSTVRSRKRDFTGFLCLLSVIFNILTCISSSLAINRTLFLTANQLYNGTIIIGNGQINRISTYPTVDLFWLNSLRGMYVITALTTAFMAFVEITTVIFLLGGCCDRTYNTNNAVKFNRFGCRKLTFWSDKGKLFQFNLVCIGLVIILHISITIVSYAIYIPGWSSIESPHLLLLTSFAIFLCGQRYWIVANITLVGGLILSWWSFTLDYQRIMADGLTQWITIPAVENHFICDGESLNNFGPYIDYQCVMNSITTVSQLSSIIISHQLCQLFLPLFGSTLFLINIITMGRKCL